MCVDYNESAVAYEETRNVIPLVYSTLTSVLNLSADKKALDFGCGTGKYLLKLSKDFDIIPYGVEPSYAMREYASRRNPLATIVEGSHRFIPLEDKFDNIYSIDVIHHIDDLRTLFYSLQRISKVGTLLCICTETSEQLKEKYWTNYFPEIVDVDLKRFHSIDKIIFEAISAGWSYIKKISVEEEINSKIPERFIRCVTQKTLSVLSLISEDSYKNGIIKMKADYESGRIINQREGYTFVLFEREF